MTQPNSQTDAQMPLWQALLDSAGEGIWGLDLEGNCTFVNRTAVKIFGFSSAEMVGRNMHELVHHHYPDGRLFPAAECPVYDVLRRDRVLRQFADTMFRKDGSSFLAELSAEPVIVRGDAVGIVVTFRDVTSIHEQQLELRRAKEQAEQKAAELHAVMESMHEGVYISTADSAMRSNHIAKQMSGGEFPQELSTMESALAGQSSTETAHTSDRWIRSVASPVVLHGKVIGGVAVNTDVTQARLRDDALRKSEKLAAVGQLASSIAHEINNPLESITNLLYLIRQSDSMNDIQQYASLAQSELSRVTEITLQTLRFNRQQSKPVSVDVADLLRTVMALYTGRVLVRDVKVSMKLGKTPRITALEGELRQVINNLVRNALDAMGKGGRLLIRLHRQTNWHTRELGVRLAVADTGEGIAPHMMKHLFEAFQTTKETTGTGLGLWVSKGIVEKHGGTIKARTRRDHQHCTVFTVWLPVSPPASLGVLEG